MKGSRISTKRGDGGETDLGKDRVGKDHPIIELVGTLDELQACLGMAAFHCPMLEEELLGVEALLYRAMALLHTSHNPRALEEGGKALVEEVEELLEGEGAEVAHAFLLPYGRSAHIHLCRAVARRAERRAVGVEKGRTLLPFLNRLSDLLYLYAYRCALSEEELTFAKGGREDSE